MAFVSLLIAGVLAAQQQEPFVIRSTTKLVLLNVVAVDRGGKPVSDLKASDFELTENGKAQKLSFFELRRSDGIAEKPIAIPQNVFSNRYMQQGTPNSATVILLDGLNTDWSQMAQARGQVIDFLTTLQPQDRVALYSVGRQLRVIHDFTTDTAELIAKLRLYRGEMTRQLEASTIQEDPGPRDATDPLAGFTHVPLLTATPIEARMNTTDRVRATLHVMEAIAAHIAGLPGRKSLVWVSSGFPSMNGFTDTQRAGMGGREFHTYTDDVNRTMRLLNHAGVAVYPVDARGLLTDPRMSAASANPSARGGGGYVPPNLETMNLIAARTGGKAFYNRNDINGAIRQAVDDGVITYTLGYYPDGEPDEKYHEIKLKVNRPGISLRHRKGYFAQGELKATDASIKTAMSQGVWTPVDATAVALNARVDHNTKSGELETLIQIDAASLTIDKTGDRWTGRADILFAQKDAEGNIKASIADTVTLNLTRERMDALLKGGLVYRKSFPRDPASVVLRIVVRDAPSGFTGTMTVPLKQVLAYTPPQPPPGATPPK